MIPHGLKIGNSFTDGGVTYKIIGFDGEGRYISQWAGNTAPEEITTPAVKTEEKTEEKITVEDVNYDEMPIKELQELCKKRGLAIRGTKADIIKRLQR